MQRIDICYILFLGDFVKKKELFEQNAVLHNRLKTTTEELNKYKKLYNTNIAEINALKEQLDELITNHTKLLEDLEKQKEPRVLEPTQEIIENTVPNSAPLEIKLEDTSAYGAEIIGKIVLEGTKISNLAAEKQSELSADVINLILGKTEVCKAKIYDICNSQIEDSKKKELLDALLSECLDYFSSLSAQM